MESIEGNKIIAEFMGAKLLSQDKRFNERLHFDKEIAPPVNFINHIRTWEKGKDDYVVAISDIKHLQYHCSWDWLMPVVEKINEICSKNGQQLSNHSRDQEHLENPLDNPLHWKSWSYHHVRLTIDINYVWKATTDFIQWFNSSNTKQK